MKQWRNRLHKRTKESSLIPNKKGERKTYIYIEKEKRKEIYDNKIIKRVPKYQIGDMVYIQNVKYYVKIIIPNLYMLTG